MYWNTGLRLYILFSFSFSLVWSKCNETSNNTTNETDEIKNDDCRDKSLGIAGIIIIVMIGIPLLIIILVILRYMLKECVFGCSACLRDCFEYFCGCITRITNENEDGSEKIVIKNKEINKILEKTFIADYNENEEYNSSCPICLDNFSSKIVKLKCNHIYHKDCISPWLKENKSCPMCREEIILNLV